MLAKRPQQSQRSIDPVKLAVAEYDPNIREYFGTDPGLFHGLDDFDSAEQDDLIERLAAAAFGESGESASKKKDSNDSDSLEDGDSSDSDDELKYFSKPEPRATDDYETYETVEPVEPAPVVVDDFIKFLKVKVAGLSPPPTAIEWNSTDQFF